MSEVPGDRSCLNLWRDGDQKAAQEIFDRYVDKLVALAKRRLNQRLVGRVDPEDIVQSVFRSFFVRAREQPFTIDGADDVCKLLVRITLNKTIKQVAFHRRGKRDAGLETGPGEKRDDLLLQHMAQGPSPEEAATFVDELEHFFAQLKPEDRQILEMRIQGYNNVEIAEKLGISDRKIRRLLERVRGLAQREEEREEENKA